MPAVPDVPPREVFQYAILRVVPSLPRGEALNVGVVVHSRRWRFLAARTHVDRARLAALDPRLDLDALQRHLRAVERIAAGIRRRAPSRSWTAPTASAG